MSRRKITSGSRFEEIARYSRAVADGDWIIVSGTIGPDPETGDMPDSAGAQARNYFTTIETALEEVSTVSLTAIVPKNIFKCARFQLFCVAV
jgi:enamine deaminase RidA (YjgF/YER057c/UK114 family)